MKFQHLIPLLCFYFASNYLLAQDSDFHPQVKLGVMAGYNNATAKDALVTFPEINSVNSFYFGASVNFQIAKQFSLEPVFLFSRKGFEAVVVETALSKFNLNYLSNQLLAKFHLIKQVALVAGAETSLLTTVSIKGNSLIEFGPYNGLDFSIIGGLEITPSENLSLNLKYNHSLTSLIEFNTTDINGNPTGRAALFNRVIMAGVTFYPFKF